MKKLTVPEYDPATVTDLLKYSVTTKAKDPWNHGKALTKTFKKEVTRLLSIEQGKKCAYCGGRLHEKKPARDHIAPWSIHKEWMYLPQNLVLSCFACNTDAKLAYDPIITKHPDYSQCVFSIIHPYIDDPKDHITFEASGLSVLVQSVNGSTKGDQTITLFQLSTPERAAERAGVLLTSIAKEDLDPNFVQLAEAVMSYALNKPLKTKAKI